MIRDLKNLRGPVRSGFEREDRCQEAALAVLMSERTKPGDHDAARSRAKVKVGRLKKREARWNGFAVRIMVPNVRFEDEQLFNELHVREILELLPAALKDETKEALLQNEGRKLRRLGRIIRNFVATA